MDLFTQLQSILPNWMASYSFSLPNGKWLGIFVIILLAFIGMKIARWAILSFINKKFIQLDEGRLPKHYKKRFGSSFGIVAFSIIFIVGIKMLGLPKEFLTVFLRISYITLAAGGVWSSLCVIDILSSYFEKMAEQTENQFDNLLVPLLRKTSKIFIICFGAIYIAHSFTLDINNLLAGLGIGGLAFALAAKDTLSNLFGSLTVVLDRPFQIGEYVKIGGEIEGMVEEVGFRSTRIRTFYNSLISVPNNKLTNIHIDNYGQREYRRMSTKIGVQYDTPPEKIEAFCEGIRQLILRHKKTRKDQFHVYFNEFSDSSLNILVYVFWKVNDWSDELAERHRLLIDILRLGQELKIDFAFPTQTLHLHKDQPLPIHQQLDEGFHQLGKEKANGIADLPITMKNPRSGAVAGDLPKDELSL